MNRLSTSFSHSPASHPRSLLVAGFRRLCRGFLVPALLVALCSVGGSEARAQKAIFNHTGADQMFVVPAGVTRLKVKLWGAGGGNNGGSGAFVTGVVTVTPGENLTVIVGGAGFNTTTNNTPGAYGGGGAGFAATGGGRSALRRGASELVTAGAGGGGRYANSAGGGAGGLLSGGDGGLNLNPDPGTAAGKGGTQSEGGAGGISSFGGNGQAGSAFQGGAGSSAGPGGGGGYYGGGGGVNGGGGGGGGSSFLANLTEASDSAAGQAATNTGASAPAGGDGDPDYAVGIGLGGVSGSAGGHGRVVLIYEAPLIVTTASDVVNALDGQTSLREAITYANTLDTRADITFNIPGGGTIALAEQNAAGARMLPILTNPHGITIDGANGGQGAIVIDGGSTSDTTGDRVFFIGVSDGEAAAATGFGSLVATKNTAWAIRNLTIRNGNARGGNGGSGTARGGGGAGLGGGVFVNAGALTLDSVDFLSCRAVGGSTGSSPSGFNSGGGGLGGNGGAGGSSGRSGGGGFGIGADGGTNLSAGQPGFYTGAAAGGAGSSGGSGGIHGGGAGSGGNGGGGGVGGGAGTSGAGGAGGFGGGGGGGFFSPSTGTAGAGGFGGGGGGSNTFGGNGGFGGGGGEGGFNGGFPGNGGFGAGNGTTSNGGGGGLGAGGAIFVRQGASVTIIDGGVTTGRVVGGSGGDPGQGIGSGIFLAGSATWEVTSGEAVNLEDSLGGGVDPQITGGFTKTGPGLLFLNGTHSHTGGTTANDGALAVNGTLSASDATTITGTATLGGNGTIVGPVNVTGSGQIYPATGSIGTLRTGPLTFASGTTLRIDVLGATSHDKLESTGAVDLGGVTLALGPGASLPPGSAPVTILEKQSAGPITGTFAGLLEGSLFNAGGPLFRISYVGGDGNDVTLTAAIGNLTRAQADADFDLFAATGAAPGSGTFSGPGVSGGNYQPGAAVGVNEITFTPTSGAPVTFTITVTETPSLVVTTTDDTRSNTDGQTTLREAFDYAESLTGPQTITFSNSTANGAVNFHDGTARTITVRGQMRPANPGLNIIIAGPGADRLKISGGGVRAIFNIGIGTELTLSDLTVADGNAVVAETSTGGVISNFGTLTLLRCVVRDSRARVGGSGTQGGGLFTSGIATIIGCTFTGNGVGIPEGSGFARGGGIYATATARVKVINSTISGNTAVVDSGTAEGAGIYAEGSGEVIELINTTVTDNTATVTGGAGATGGGVFGNVTATNSIIAGNTSSGSSPNAAGNVVSGGYNLIYVPGSSTTFSGNTTGNLTSLEPLLGPLLDNGGPTPTHALLSGSPALDAGDPAFDPNAFTPPLTTDQRGQTRVRGGTVDIGAFESASSRLYIDQSVTGGDGSGESWTHAMPELRTATAMAQTDPAVTEIWVARGTYKPAAAGGDREANFHLRSGLAIYGGFTGTETALDQRDPNPATNGTILSGDLNGNDGDNFANNGDNSFSVVIGSTTDDTAVLSGFTIRGGHANGGPGNADGAGIRNDGGSPTLTHVTISGNRANGIGGGGILNTNGSSPTLSHVTISGNRANGIGGGILNINSNPTLTNVAISGNWANSGGGGMGNANSSPTLTNVTISGNRTTSNGGGIRNDAGSNPILRNSIVWGNVADGGGDSIFGDSPTITHSLIQGGFPGTGNLDADPLFIAPVTATTGNPTTAGNFRLQPGSPAINSGDNSLIPAGITTDLDGAARIIGANVDLGAYELIAPPTLTNAQLSVVNGSTLNDLAALTGASPDGGVFSGTGVSVDGNGGYVFDSTGLALGTQVTITYTVSGPNGTSNATTAVITVTETPSLTVTTTSDTSTNVDGLISLREAIIFLNGGNAGANPVIRFDPALLGGLIRLGNALPEITRAVTIEGDVNDDDLADLTISGDASGDDLLVAGSASITDIAASRTANVLGDNVRIFHSTSSLALNGLVLTGGISPTDGGAILASSASVSNATISGNSVKLGFGGGIYAANVTLSNATVSGNASPRDGGGIYGTGTVVVTGSTLSGNTAEFHGGAIFAATATVVNATLSGNAASLGNGAGIYAGLVTLNHATLSGNSAAGVGGGFFTGGSATLANSIVLGNETGFGAEVSGTIAYQGVNIVGEGSDSDASDGVVNATSLDAVFAGVSDNPFTLVRSGTLADNGGSTLTIALAAGSPAIDAGNDALAVDANNQPLTTDQRGQARVTKGRQISASPTVDIGAYELFAAPEFLTDEIRIPIDGQPLNLASATGVAPGGGVFSGPGVSGGFFDPRTQGAGVYRVTYTVTDAFGVINSSEVTITVLDLPSALTLTQPKRFKTTLIGERSRTQRVYLRNVGGLPVTGLRVELSGRAKQDYRIVAPASRILEAGASTYFQVTFQPRKPGNRKAVVTVTSDSDPVSAKLKGRGQSKSGVRPPRAVK